MFRRVGGKLTYANVMATVATFLALGGGAYAVSTAPHNSVKSSSIKNGQVKSVDLRNGQVRTSDLANRAVTPAKAANVRRIHFSTTACFDGSETGCTADIATFGGWKLHAQCTDGLPTLALSVVAPGSVATSVVSLENAQPTVINGNHGSFLLFDFNGHHNTLGTIVVANGSEQITIPFHAYSGPGTEAGTGACVFEGTATRA